MEIFTWAWKELGSRMQFVSRITRTNESESLKKQEFFSFLKKQAKFAEISNLEFSKKRKNFVYLRDKWYLLEKQVEFTWK